MSYTWNEVIIIVSKVRMNFIFLIFCADCEGYGINLALVLSLSSESSMSLIWLLVLSSSCKRGCSNPINFFFVLYTQNLSIL